MLTRCSRYWKVIAKGAKTLEKGDFIKEEPSFTEISKKQFAELFSNGDAVIKPNSHVDQMLVGSLFSKAIGNNLPSSIYLSQSFVFKRRVLLNEPLTVLVEVRSITPQKKRIELSTKVLATSTSELLVDGTATIMYPELQMTVPPA